MKTFFSAVSASCFLSGAVALPSNIQRRAATVTGVNLQLPTNAFSSSIEGAAVNSNGQVFAAGFQANGEAATSAYAFFGKGESGTNDILGQDNPYFIASDNNTANPPLLAGGRFLKDGRLLLTDASNKRVLAVNNAENGYNIFCADSNMLQPNDLALSAQRDSLIYLSGQNYTANTTAGLSGDLWTCDGGLATQFPTDILAAAGIHRTNGIEASPDGQYLYVSSAKNVEGAVVENKIFRFSLNSSSGVILESAPTVFFDFADTAATDIDGMRADTQGNLFVTRNGLGQVVKLSPEGELLLTIEFPGMGGPSNLEFGGCGSTLYVIGRCAENATIGCAGSYETDSVGRAFSALQS